MNKMIRFLIPLLLICSGVFGQTEIRSPQFNFWGKVKVTGKNSHGGPNIPGAILEIGDDVSPGFLRLPGTSNLGSFTAAERLLGYNNVSKRLTYFDGGQWRSLTHDGDFNGFRDSMIIRGTFNAGKIVFHRSFELANNDTLNLVPYFLPYNGAVDNVNLGNYRLTARSIKTDSIYTNSPAGMYLTTNTGTAIARWGLGGSSEATFYGFAGMDFNRSGSMTSTSFTPKVYVDSLTLARLPIVNVKSYGAVGNGIADDWAAILAASTYAEQNNMTLYFPSGTYHTSGSLTDSYSRTNTTSFSILFGDNVKIKVIDTSNFATPTSRVLFGYYTGTVPHSFTVTGGNVEIDGNNMINAAFVASQTTNENLAFKIACANLKIKNLFSNGYANGGTHAIYALGSYPLMEIRNVTIDSVSRSASVNTTVATQAILIASQLGKTIIDNVVVKNIGSTSLTQDCDGIVVRGIIGGSFDFVGGDFTIQNSYILNSRGRAIKAQSSNVKVYNTKIEQSDLLTFNSVNSIDFQVGNGIVDGCTFVYGAGTLGTSFSSIAFQERVRFVDLTSRATNNTVLSKSQFAQFAVVISSATNAASADIRIENNTIIPYDTVITNVLTRGLVEFTANELLALPPSSKWSFTIKNNTTFTSAYLLTYTGYTSGDISNKLKFDISGNKNYGTGLGVFNQISGNRITNVKKYRFKNNSGWSNYLPQWNVDFTTGAIMPDNEFTAEIATSTFTNAPASFPASGRAVIQIGDSSTVGQIKRINIGDSTFQFYQYATNWVSQPMAASSYLTNTAAATTYKAISDSFFTNGYTTRARTKQITDSLGAAKQNVLTNPVTGTGTAAQLAIWGSSSSIQGNSNITYDNASLRLILGSTFGSLPDGVGTAFNPNFNVTTPSGVAGISVLVNDGTNNRRAGLFVDQTNAVWGLSSSNSSGPIPFVLRVGGSERLRATTSGNIGIGNLGSNAKLEVSASSGEVFRADASGGAFRVIADQTGVRTQGTFAHTGTATVSSSLTAGSIIRSGGTSSQFLKADGSVDNNTYATTGALSGYLPLSGGTLTGALVGTTSAFNSSTIGSASNATTLLTMFVGYSSSNTQRGAIVWNDGSGVTGKIHSSYNGSNSTKLHFGGLYNGSYNQGDLMVLDGITNSVTLTGALSGTSLSMSGGGSFASVSLASGNNLTWGGSYAANIPTMVGVSGVSPYLAVYSAGSTSSENFRFSGDGTFLINTTTPEAPYKLIVNGGVKATSTSTSVGQLTLQGGSSISTASSESGEMILGSNSLYRGKISYNGVEGILYIDNSYNNDNGDVIFRTKSAGTVLTPLTIKGSGAASFSSSVTVGSNISINANGTSFQWTNTGNNVAMNATSGVWKVFTGTSSYVEALSISATQAATFSSSVNTVINATSSTTNSRINFSHSSNGGLIGYANLGAGAQNNVFYVTTGSGTIGSGMNIDNNGAAVFASTVTATGFIKSGGTSTQSLMADGSTRNVNQDLRTTDNVTFNQVTASSGFFDSDLRLKNILKRDGDVVYYTWKDKNKDTKTHIGYVAQELQKTNPNQVNTNKDGMLSVNYTEILVQKVRELEKKVELLNKKLNSVKNKR